MGAWTHSLQNNCTRADNFIGFVYIPADSIQPGQIHKQYIHNQVRMIWEIYTGEAGCPDLLPTMCALRLVKRLSAFF